MDESKEIETPQEQSLAPENNLEEIQVNNQHALFVRDQALFLFDRTRTYHDLNDISQEVLAEAALLHDEPFPPAKNPLKAARKIVRKGVKHELSDQQVSLLAMVTSLQRGKIKRKDIERLDLSPIQQREALTLAALLRIAIGLDQSSSQTTQIMQIEPAQRQVWIVVDGPQGVVDAAAAQHNARMWASIGFPEVKIMNPVEARSKLLPYPDPLDEVGMLASDRFSEAGRKVMLYQFAEMLKYEAGTRLGEDIEALHDMRVATRRLRASFEIFGEAFDRQAINSHLRGLRMTGRALGRVRDLDVMIEKTCLYQDSLTEAERSGIEPFLEYLKTERDKARQAMLTFMDSGEYRNFKRKFNVFVQTTGTGELPVSPDTPTPSLVCEVAPAMIYTRLAHVRAFESYLEGAPIERLHALRIEFKKFRYTVEFFREVLGGETKSLINQLKKIQDHLGDLNDAHVASIALQEYLDHLQEKTVEMDSSLSQAVFATSAYLANRQVEMQNLKDSFQEIWVEFETPEFRKYLSEAVSIL